MLKFELAGSKDSPIINPAFVFKNTRRNELSLDFNGEEIPAGKDFRVGYRDNLDGTMDAIIWIRKSSSEPSVITIKRQ